MPKEDNLDPIDQLESRIKQFKTSHTKNTRSENQRSGFSALGLSLELVSAIAVGSVIGYLIDQKLNTKPLFFLICFFIGAAAGGLTIFKLIKKIDKEELDSQNPNKSTATE